MINYQNEAKKVLDSYKEDTNEEFFDILHMYPGKLCKSNGIFSYRFFKVIGYNRVKRTKKDLGEHDEIRQFRNKEERAIEQVAIFADRSTLLLLTKLFHIDYGFQTLYIKN